MKKLFSVLLAIINNFAILNLVILCVLVFANVIARTFFSSIVWTEEVVRFAFVYVTFFGAIVALKDKRHFTVNLLTEILPKKIQLVVDLIGKLLILFVLYLFLTGIWEVTLINNDKLSSVAKIPYSAMYGVGIIASISMAVITVIHIIDNFKDQNVK